MDEEEGKIAVIGAQIGSRLAKAKSSAMQPSVAVRVFVQALLGEYPNVKLPELIADDEVKRWLDQRTLGEGQLRQALTEMRRSLRSKLIDQPIKRPRQRKTETTELQSRPSQSMVGAAVPNRPLSEL